MALADSNQLAVVRSKYSLNSHIIKLEELIAEFGPQTTEELTEKTGLDPKKLCGILSDKNSRFNKIRLDTKNISDFYGMLKGKLLIYQSFQEIELGMRIGYNICRSKTHQHLDTFKCHQITTGLDTKVSKRTLAVIHLQYPKVLSYFINVQHGKFDKAGKRCGAAYGYWDEMRKGDVKFVEGNELTDYGEKVIFGAWINKKLGYDAFLTYWRILRK